MSQLPTICDDCKKINPFTVEVDIDAEIDEDGNVSFIYDIDTNLRYAVSIILNKLQDKYKENGIRINKVWEEGALIVTLVFIQGLHLELEFWSSSNRNVFIHSYTYASSKKHYLGTVDVYGLGNFVVKHLEEIGYLTPDERTIKDVIE